MNKIKYTTPTIFKAGLAIMLSFFLLLSTFVQAKTTVDIDLKQPEHHTAQVTITVETSDNALVDFQLPAWRTGRYQIINLANGIRMFTAKDAKGKVLAWEKTDKSTWQVSNPSKKSITISYQVYANELGKRTRHIDDSHAFIDASAVIMYTQVSKQKQHVINLQVPKKWRSVSGLNFGENKHQFIAKNYDVLVDSPIETGINELHLFEVDNRKYELVIWGKGNYDSKKMVEDLTAMVEQAKHIWQDYPFSRYVFMVHATSGARGATEHLNSTIIQRSRFKFSSRKDYLGIITTAAHEFIHTWNVKKYRPQGLVPYDYQKENYSNLLWLAEGSTSYLQNQLLLRGDLMSSKEFLEMLAKRITGYEHKPGRNSQNVAQASFDNWIDAGGDYANNHSVNIYSEGFLVSWMLDFSIMEQTKAKKSYRDVHQALSKDFSIPKTYNDNDLLNILKKLTKHDYKKWWNTNVHGYAKPDFNVLLAKAGLTQSYGKVDEETKKTKQQTWTGLKTSKSTNGLKVTAVEKNSPAWKAGLTLGDIIIALDGLRMSDSSLDTRLKNFKVDQNIEISFFRRDELNTTLLTLGAVPKDKLKIVPLEKVSNEQKQFFKMWTGVDFPEEKK